MAKCHKIIWVPYQIQIPVQANGYMIDQDKLTFRPTKTYKLAEGLDSYALRYFYAGELWKVY